MTYRVRENTRDIKGSPGHSGFRNYYGYTSPEFSDYYEALKYAIELEKKGHYPNWVDCMDTYEYFDSDEVMPDLIEMFNSSYELT